MLGILLPGESKHWTDSDAKQGSSKLVSEQDRKVAVTSGDCRGEERLRHASDTSMQYGSRRFKSLQGRGVKE